MNPNPRPSVSVPLDVDAVAARAHALLDAGDVEAATRTAMNASDAFLVEHPDRYREDVFRRLFERFIRGYVTQYQPYDFELVDYQLYRFAANMPLVRGPRPEIYDVVSGNYAVVLGAAQLFGRFQPRSINTLFKERFGLPVLNLAIGGVGPLFFYEHPAVMAACARAKFVVLQILSGRSIGCEEYPGERMTAPANTPGAPRRDRIDTLRDIWAERPEEAVRLIRKWNKNYISAYASLIERIGRPVILIWVSDRSPDQWEIANVETRPDFGRFPQLVSREMVEAVSRTAHASVEGQKDRWLGQDTTSRLTGEPAPFFYEDGPDFKQRWQNGYYASRESIEDIVDHLEPVVRSLL